MPRFCASCGAQVADAATFCAGCGTPAGQTAGAPAAAPTSGPAPVAAPAAGGLDDNVAGALAYLFIPAIIFLVMEPYNKKPFIRFHAFQCLFLCGISIALSIGGMILAVIPIIGWLLSILLMFVTFGIFIVAIICLIKALQGQMWKVPVIGDLAEKQANAV